MKRNRYRWRHRRRLFEEKEDERNLIDIEREDPDSFNREAFDGAWNSRSNPDEYFKYLAEKRKLSRKGFFEKYSSIDPEEEFAGVWDLTDLKLHKNNEIESYTVPDAVSDFTHDVSNGFAEKQRGSTQASVTGSSKRLLDPQNLASVRSCANTSTHKMEVNRNLTLDKHKEGQGTFISNSKRHSRLNDSREKEKLKQTEKVSNHSDSQRPSKERMQTPLRSFDKKPRYPELLVDLLDAYKKLSISRKLNFDDLDNEEVQRSSNYKESSPVINQNRLVNSRERQSDEITHPSLVSRNETTMSGNKQRGVSIGNKIGKTTSEDNNGASGAQKSKDSSVVTEFELSKVKNSSSSSENFKRNGQSSIVKKSNKPRQQKSSLNSNCLEISADTGLQSPRTSRHNSRYDVIDKTSNGKTGKPSSQNYREIEDSQSLKNRTFQSIDGSAGLKTSEFCQSQSRYNRPGHEKKSYALCAADKSSVDSDSSNNSEYAIPIPDIVKATYRSLRRESKRPQVFSNGTSRLNSRYDVNGKTSNGKTGNRLSQNHPEIEDSQSLKNRKTFQRIDRQTELKTHGLCQPQSRYNRPVPAKELCALDVLRSDKENFVLISDSVKANYRTPSRELKRRRSSLAANQPPAKKSCEPSVEDEMAVSPYGAHKHRRVRSEHLI